ncbi:YopT-type cysteine protease domain-containing protein [Brucella anthropi]|uniref:YopT-type cysteine protease domain-containing protein n=1 Tax=Brucella anthropi TaxID=529 RepID=UPI00384D19B8
MQPVRPFQGGQPVAPQLDPAIQGQSRSSEQAVPGARTGHMVRRPPLATGPFPSQAANADPDSWQQGVDIWPKADDQSPVTSQAHQSTGKGWADDFDTSLFADHAPSVQTGYTSSSPGTAFSPHAAANHMMMQAQASQPGSSGLLPFGQTAGGIKRTDATGRSRASIFGHIEIIYKQSEISKRVYEEFGVKTQVTDSGVCMAMSAKYLVKSSQGKEFYSWLADSSAKWEILSQYLDNDYQPLPPPDSQDRIQDELKEHFKQVGTYFLESEDFAPGFAAQAMSLALSDEKTSYNMSYLISPNNGPGHAVACIKDEQDHVRFMDPNIGEFSFTSSDEFENWMSSVFYKHYAAFSHMIVNFYEVPSPDKIEAMEMNYKNS